MFTPLFGILNYCLYGHPIKLKHINQMVKNCKIQINAVVLVYFALMFFVAAMLTSCSNQKHVNYYQQHLRSTHHQNFITQDNGGCNWSR
jgi:hypothetical protein